ncbi:copper amine oxidase N-terminal domain-containing protein [Paenibacillus amylolyticus]|uniref:copper amine oxidase N-terminal domain-containing protein n=1 Tax=Paenibacillus amylolyticus TaxID=1451 RepID=UPI003D9761B5
MKHLKKVVVVALVMSVLLPLGAQKSEAASKYVDLEIQWADGRINHVETLHKDGVTYGSFFSLGIKAGLEWEMEDDNTAVLKNSEKHIVVHMGSSIAEVDGQKVDMGSKPVRYISHLYVPIKFLASAFDGEVAHQDPKTNKVTVTGVSNYTDTFYGSNMGYIYVIHVAKGDLEITNASTGQKSLIPLGIKDMNVNTHDLKINFKRSAQNLLIVIIEHTNRKTEDYDLYTLVFKNKGLVRKSIAHGITGQYEILNEDSNIQLIDDNSIRIIEDGSGKVLEVLPR